MASLLPPSHLQSSTRIDNDLKKINQEMYEHNLELAIRNRTLSVLRRIYEIMNTSFGVKDTAEKLVQAIAQELHFKKISLALISKDHKSLDAIATYPHEEVDELSQQYFNTKFETLNVPLSQTDNFCVSSLLHRQTRLTTSIFDLFVPLISEVDAQALQEKLGIETSIIYPVYFGNIGLGVLVFGLDKHIGDLSRGERESIRELISVVAIAIERAQTYENLQEANNRLKQMDKLKDEFLSVASHELRTPMTAIKSYVWMVLNGKAGNIEPKAHEYLDRVFQSSQRLINLVNDMLDVSRIEGGRVQWRPESFDMGKVANDVKNEFMARAAEKNLTLSVDIQGTIPQITADREKIQQVFENLVGNALKFTPAQGIITMSISSADGYVRVRIHDTGCGISKEDIPKLFAKFGRLTNALSDVPGTGLGLYISKQYVELQKGKIWVESEVGKGSTFAFELPVNVQIPANTLHA